MNHNKNNVKNFWNEASCGELAFYTDNQEGTNYHNEESERYRLEPYIIDFADFKSYSDKLVLEIGVGLGCDHVMFARHGAILHGIDLTERGVLNTKNRLRYFSLSSKLSEGDAENLDFQEGIFDLVYSWGVLHHSPDTPKAISEVYRVLKTGGEAKIMIYNKYSIVGFMLWLRYGFFTGNLKLTLSEIYDKFLESPGTKAYTTEEARLMFSSFRNVEITTVLTHGDLLSSNVAGQRHRGFFLSIGRILLPRFIIKYFFKNSGLFMQIKAIK
jgi:SAM-dependent methyltransferase